MQQLPLPIGFETSPTFESFVVGSSGAAVAHLQRMAHQASPAFLWGPSGAGKSHLLQSLVCQIHSRGGRVGWFHPQAPLPWNVDETLTLLVIDDCDGLGVAQQQAAFGLFIEAATLGIAVVAAARVPPIDLQVREDLRSRLGWGPVFALQPLSESEVRGALRREADRRGLFLSDEVMTHLLTRFERDLKSLMGLLDRLDQFALVHKRAITIPLLKQMLNDDAADA
jgi:DnaA-homolog protein